MSLEEDNRSVLVRMEMEKAYHTFHVAELLSQGQGND